jgi:hypothetical protein
MCSCKTLWKIMSALSKTKESLISIISWGYYWWNSNLGGTHRPSILTEKLNTRIVMIKRIKSCVRKAEYLKILYLLFRSLSYCISCWGRIPDYKLQKIFAIQKRCVRLLFGETWIGITENIMKHVLVLKL